MLKAVEIIRTVTTELRQRCQCDFQSDLISNVRFICFPWSPNAVTFRALMAGSHQVAAPQLVIFMEQWITSSPFLIVQSMSLRVDGNCAVAIASLDEEECMPEGILYSTSKPSSEPTSSTESSPAAVNSLVVGVGVSVAVIVVLIVTIAATVVFVHIKRWKKNIPKEVVLQS